MPTITLFLALFFSLSSITSPCLATDRFSYSEPSLLELVNDSTIGNKHQIRPSQIFDEGHDEYSVAALFAQPVYASGHATTPIQEKGYSIATLLAQPAPTKQSTNQESIAPHLLVSEETIYHVGAGDVLDIQVWGEADFSRQVTVRQDGFITLPLIGDIHAAQQPITLIQVLIQQRLAELVNDPMVTITLQECNSRHYYMVGKVAQPGEYVITRPISILQSLARAGGFQEWARRDAIKIIRQIDDRQAIITFNYEALAQGDASLISTMLIAGDTIIIE